MKEIEVFIDGVDYRHEVGEARGGNIVYGSVKDLKHHNSCWAGCGIVRAKVVGLEWVEPQDFKKELDDEGKETAIQKSKEHLLERKKRLERQISFIDKELNREDASGRE